MMPLPILLAHKLTKGLTDDRKAGKVDFLRPDSKSQVSVVYENNEPKYVSAVVVSPQHTPSANQQRITEDGREATRHAVRTAAANDVILIAGKGHEDTQEIAGAKLPFSDAAEARAALAARRAAA